MTRSAKEIAESIGLMQAVALNVAMKCDIARTITPLFADTCARMVEKGLLEVEGDDDPVYKVTFLGRRVHQELRQ